jgi:hypothetical protein
VLDHLLQQEGLQCHHSPLKAQMPPNLYTISFEKYYTNALQNDGQRLSTSYQILRPNTMAKKPVFNLSF